MVQSVDCMIGEPHFWVEISGGPEHGLGPTATEDISLLADEVAGVGKQRPGRQLSSSPTESARTHVEVSSAKGPPTGNWAQGLEP